MKECFWYLLQRGRPLWVSGVTLCGAGLGIIFLARLFPGLPPEGFLKRQAAWEANDTMFVVVDEIGMVGPGELSNVDTMCGRLIGCRGKRYGAMHMITSGDFTQKGMFSLCAWVNIGPLM